ncbi:hypothetical protein [uncultured Serinicoccus sp.]|uniref:hypothetical protein n=1 Tax=uncultured Serinicoccus sp. TaxID=735514 RepID=UPI0026064017|nr:hypothetical protein [uncultured Serinicoccus sp.]
MADDGAGPGVSEPDDGPRAEDDGHESSSGELLGRSVVGGVGATIGTTVGPEATVAVALATPFLDAALMATIRRAGEWTETFGKRAARNGDAEGLAEHLRTHPQAAALLTDVAFVAARTDYEVKLEAMGQAIADGVLYEKGVIYDAEALVVRAVSALERVHVAVLAEVVRARSGASAELIADRIPEAKKGLDSAFSELERLGLVRLGDGGDWESKRPVEGKLERIIGLPNLRKVGMSQVNSIESRMRELAELMLAVKGEGEVYRASRTGIAVMRRYVSASDAVGEPLTFSPNSADGQPGSEEYLGPVVPQDATWDQGVRHATMLAVRRGERERTSWKVVDGRWCESCSRPLVKEVVYRGWKDEKVREASDESSVCPRGHRNAPPRHS